MRAESIATVAAWAGWLTSAAAVGLHLGEAAGAGYAWAMGMGIVGWLVRRRVRGRGAQPAPEPTRVVRRWAA